MNHGETTRLLLISHGGSPARGTPPTRLASVLNLQDRRSRVGVLDELTPIAGGAALPAARQPTEELTMPDQPPGNPGEPYRRFTEAELRELNLRAGERFARMFLRTVEIQKQATTNEGTDHATDHHN